MPFTLRMVLGRHPASARRHTVARIEFRVDKNFPTSRWITGGGSVRLAALLLFLALSAGCTDTAAPVSGGLGEPSSAPDEPETPSGAAAESPAYWRNHIWVFEIEDNRGSLGF